MTLDEAVEDNGSTKKGSGTRLVVLITVVAAGILIFQFTSFNQYLQPERLQALLQSISGFWWAPLAYIAIYAGGTLVAAPGLLLTILGGLTFGTMNGTLYVLVGSNLGANLGFGLARKLGRDFVASKVSGPIDAIDRQLRNQGLLRVLQLRLIPIVPFNLLNYACGLSGVRHAHYLLGTLFGMIPGIFVYVYSASALAQLYFAGTGVQDEEAIAVARQTAMTNVGISLGLLVIVSLVPYIYRRIRGTSPDVAG